MLVTCPTCHVAYDDADRWTICPHGPLWAAHDAYCREHDLVNCQFCKKESPPATTNKGTAAP